MPQIPRYNKLSSKTELGSNAELSIDSTCFDVAGMTVREVMVTYEPDILNAEKSVLVSEDAGTWQWNRDRKTWERR